MKPLPRGRLETIQTLRGIAVLAVVISHVMHELAALLAGHVRNFDEKLFPGDFGVDLFFVISGFIMVYVCRDLFATAGAPLDYLRRRIVRIVPLYWIMTTAMIAVVVVLPNDVRTATNDPWQWLTSYFFIPYTRHSDGLVRPVLGLGWTLQYEMFFYALFALGLFLPRRFAIPFVGAMLVAACLVGNHLGGGDAIARFLAHPITTEFVAGMVLGWAFVAGARIARPICVMLALAGIGLLCAAPSFSNTVDLTRHIHYGIPATLIVASAILFPGAEHFRTGRVLLEAGETSYSTYLTHPFVLGGMSLVSARLALPHMLGAAAFSTAYLAVACVACMLTGYAVHYLLDVPVTRRVGAFLRPRAGTMPPPADDTAGQAAS